MRGYTIFLALFVFSLTSNAVSELSVTDSAGIEHKVYGGVTLPNQNLNMTEEQVEQFTSTATDTSSAIDALNMVSFVMFKMLPMLLSSLLNALYIVGWLGAWGVPHIIAWCLQVPLWIVYTWDLFQIVSNRSLKSFE